MTVFRKAAASVRARLAGRFKVQASLWYASSSIVCQAMRFCGILVSTRFIEKEQFGFFAQGTLSLMFASLLRDIGQTNALLGYRGGDRRYAVFSSQLNFGLGLAAAVLLWVALVFAPGIPRELSSAAPLLALITLTENLTQTGLIMAQKEFRFALLARVEAGAVAVWLCTMGAFMARIEGCMVLFAAQFAEVAFRFAAIFAASGRRFLGWAVGEDLKQHFFSRFARHLIPQNILQALTGRLDFLLLSIFSTREQLGIYERMLQYIRIPWSLSINLVDRVLLASYSRDQDNTAVLRTTLRKSMYFIAAAVTTAVVVATLVVALVLKFFIGEEWARTIVAHWWVALPFAILTPFVWNLNIFFQGTGRAAQLLRNTVFLFLAMLVVGLPAAPCGSIAMLLAQGSAYTALLLYQAKVVKSACL